MSSSVVAQWVESAPDDRQLAFRRCVQTLLLTIANSNVLRSDTVFKGGILLGIHYESDRFTKDLDASNHVRYSADFQAQLLDEIEAGLPAAVESLAYGLDCRVQGHELKPKRPDASYQTLEIRIGYAYVGQATHRHLMRGASTHIVKVDYSFNERTHDIDRLTVVDDHDVCVYGLHTLIAEKYRAILQQETRGRTRPQDAFDIDLVLQQKHADIDAESRSEILAALIEKSKARGLEVDSKSMSNPEIRRRSEMDYPQLADLLPDRALPPFDEVWTRVVKFYESLPWDD